MVCAAGSRHLTCLHFDNIFHIIIHSKHNFVIHIQFLIHVKHIFIIHITNGFICAGTRNNNSRPSPAYPAFF